ncbi:tuberin-like [Uloborus diversus]|uniref:tuberin-like n=1 Tax=Uloborus diversus TaxID=327109 RepID=UPI0024098415|nr:tuberin-like [Uloborus diversus]
MFTNANQTKDDILLHFPRHHSSGSLSHRRHTTYFPNDSQAAASSYGEWSLGKKEREERGGHLCSCWCTSWAEVHIRRPTGNTSWMMKIQNQLFLPSSPPEFPLSVINSLVLPQNRDLDVDSSLPSTEEEYSDLNESQLGEASDGAIEILPCSKPNPPVRRTNSSPDMNTGLLQYEKLANEQNERLELANDIEKQRSQCMENENFIKEDFPLNKSSEILNSKGALKLDLPSKSEVAELNFSRENMCEPSSAKVLSSIECQQQASMSSFRDRGHTISVMSPSRPNGSDNSVKRPELNRRSGMSPSFVFLQLFHNSCFGPVTHKPLLLLQTEANNRALSVLDHIPPYDTHKIGVVYIGPGQLIG